MSRNATMLALLALAGSAGIASAQVFIPMNAPGKNYNEGRSNTGAEGIVAFEGQRDNGDPVAGLWDWHTGTVYEMPQPTDDLGNALEFEIFKFRQSPERGPGDPIKGINIGLIKKPVHPNAALWDTTDGMPGLVSEPQNAYGAYSWATSANVGGAVTVGALWGDIDGAGNTSYAAIWRDGGDAQRMPIPVDAGFSEAWDIRPNGDIACGAIGAQGSSSDQPRPKLKPSVDSGQQKGIIWDLRDDSYRVIEPGNAGAESLVITALADDQTLALAATRQTDQSIKSGLYDLSSDSFTLLDAGDVNGDGQIDFNDFHNSDAYALSADGSVIGGSYTLPGGEETAAFWTASDGYQMHDLASYLMGEGVVGLDGWRLGAITGVSADGTQFSGWGYNPAGQADVWVAVIPAPGPVALAVCGGLLGWRRR